MPPLTSQQVKQLKTGRIMDLYSTRIKIVFKMNISLAYTFQFKLAWISISMVELPLCLVAILEYLASFYMPGAVKGMSRNDFFVHFPFLLRIYIFF